MKRVVATLPILLAAAAVVLGACGPAPAGSEPPPKEPLPTTALPPVEASAAPTVGALTATEPAPLPTDPPPPKPVRSELEATDPTGVSLANGRPTLVEFFAFW